MVVQSARQGNLKAVDQNTVLRATDDLPVGEAWHLGSIERELVNEVVPHLNYAPPVSDLAEVFHAHPGGLHVSTIIDTLYWEKHWPPYEISSRLSDALSVGLLRPADDERGLILVPEWS